ncbi:MAG: glutathione S-transferase family protein [Gammaproteobacteria bacterium]|nr:glutathione S-transferase family protein [Gammaproteobacteria bacterium]MBU0770423.1 glutathione S-transferase family protein [Gammaproteobacteria bacterium]MBU0855151.1 glutathione S-transferase family protein [Gammaproteobacteria bacterium]MBU1847341.1 glutathione S-transferase family protein [Gammaproteobacteria bacterium]
MIRLFQFPPAMGLPNASGFCLKLETWLRMAGLPYQNVHTMNLARAPKGKLPHVDDDGVAVADSGFIIEHLTQRYGVTLDRHLDAGARAQSLLLQRALEEHLYWCMLYFRWADDRYWPATREAFFGALGAPRSWFVPALVRKAMVKQVSSAGIGRHSTEEVVTLAMQDVGALATVLGDKPFLFGAPSSIDASAYGMLANLLFVDIDLPLKRRVIQDFPKVVAYCERMRQVYWHQSLTQLPAHPDAPAGAGVQPSRASCSSSLPASAMKSVMRLRS